MADITRAPLSIRVSEKINYPISESALTCLSSLVMGGKKPTTLTGKGKEVLLMAGGAADFGKSLF